MTKMISITPKELADLMKNNNLKIIDIRDYSTFKKSHITTAQHIDNSNLNNFLINTSFTDPIVVVCYHGISSINVANYLIEYGFQKVYNLTGGYKSWDLEFPL